MPIDPDELYTTVVDPLFEPLNAKRVDWKALRSRLPKAAKGTTRRTGRVRVEGARVHAGSLACSGGVELEEGGLLVVWGDLTITGGVFSPPLGYSLVLVGGKLAVDRLHTSGDVIAFGGVRGTLVWGSYNDHSTYAPTLVTATYIASDDRSDIIGTLSAKKKLVGFDLGAKLRQAFPGLDPEDEASVRALVGVAKQKPRIQKATAGEADKLRAELAAALRIKDRIEQVKAVRAVYATIKRRRLADLGELLVEQIHRKNKPGSDWSMQDELELLADLGRADLLAALPKKLRGYESWIPALLARAGK